MKAPDGSPLEDCFNPTKLKDLKLSVYGVAWWDEMHPECKIGSGGAASGRKAQVRFKHDGEMGLNEDEGTYRTEDVKYSVKYSARE